MPTLLPKAGETVQKLYHKDSKSWHLYRVVDQDLESSSEPRPDADRRQRVIWGSAHVETEAHGDESQPFLERGDSGHIVPSCGFRFTTNGRVRVVVLKHKNDIAYVICDGTYVNAVAYDHAHMKRNGSFDIYFKIKVPEERRSISAVVKISLNSQRWDYTLTANSVEIPMCWISTHGYNHLAHVPEVAHPDRLPSAIARRQGCHDLAQLMSGTSPEGPRIERMFCFATMGHLRTVAFCRRDRAGHNWNVVLDGDIVANITPTSNNTVAFEVLVPGGEIASAKAQLHWKGLRTGWDCVFYVNDVPVPPSLSSGNGGFSTLYGPEVIDVENNAIDPGKVMENYSATDSSWHFVQVFQFTTQGQLRSVAISHSRCVWHFFCDGIEVQRSEHPSEVLKSRKEKVLFEVPVQHGHALSAVATMQWHVGLISCWTYSLEVNGVPLQVYWSLSEGTHCAPLFEVEHPEAHSKKRVKLEAPADIDGTPTEGLIDRSFTTGSIDSRISEQDSEEVAHVGHSPYSIGDYVQYYSWSNRKWLLGIFRGRQGCTEFYIVDIFQGQRRFHVHLDCLRSPFQAGELVEVYSKRRGWLPGSVSGHQDPRGAIKSGYKVQVEGFALSAPNERLRRRFLAGASVEIWEGPVTGWAVRRVHETQMGRDGLGSAPLLDSYTPVFLKSQQWKSQQMFSTAQTDSMRRSSEAHIRACRKLELDHGFEEEAQQPSIESQLDPWTCVTLVPESLANSADIVPLFVLRNIMPETSI